MIGTGFRTDFALQGMGRATGLIIVLVLALTCCSGEKENGKPGEGSEVDQKSRKDCEKISKRNLECIGVLVSIVEKESRSIMAGVLNGVENSERTELKARMEQALESGKEDLTDTLRESLRKPFMNWCLRAAGDPEGQKLLDLALKCLEKPDCQTYGACFEEILALQRPEAESLQQK